jgi:hypothetical protein
MSELLKPGQPQHSTRLCYTMLPSELPLLGQPKHAPGCFTPCCPGVALQAAQAQHHYAPPCCPQELPQARWQPAISTRLCYTMLSSIFQRQPKHSKTILCPAMLPQSCLYPGAAQASAPGYTPCCLEPPCSSSISAPAMPHHRQFELPRGSSLLSASQAMPRPLRHASAMHQHAWRFLIIAQVSAPGYANFHAVLGAVSGSSPPAPGLCPTMLPRAGPYTAQASAPGLRYTIKLPSELASAAKTAPGLCPRHAALRAPIQGSPSISTRLCPPCCPEPFPAAAVRVISIRLWPHHAASELPLRKGSPSTAPGYVPTPALSFLTRAAPAQHQAMPHHKLLLSQPSQGQQQS